MTDRPAAPADLIREITRSQRFLAADRANLTLNEIETWDPYLLRESRLLVPIDLQALYVQPGSLEPMVRLPMAVARPDDEPGERSREGMPPPFTEGTPRPAGIHLHWAMPDALLRGTLAQQSDGSSNRLALPVLPDRWVVLRVLRPRAGRDVLTTGWVLEADRAVAVPLAQWTEGGAASRTAKAHGEPLAKHELTGTVGGSVNWSGVYDAVLNRFAFHDPLADVATLTPEGVDGESASYLVAGWWSDPVDDPLDAARSSDSLHELLERLRWRLMAEWGDAQSVAQRHAVQSDLRQALGLNTGDRHAAAARPLANAKVPRPAKASPLVPMDTTFVERTQTTAASAFVSEAATHFVAPAWHLRSSLLHGAIYGVPVAGKTPIDRRPATASLSVAFGRHDDDLLAALASPPSATSEQRRTIERLLAAFTSQRINRLASADGIVDLEEHEHSAAFSSIPAGMAGTDRYLQRVQTGGVGGLDVGKRRRGTGTSNGTTADGVTVFSTKQKPTLVVATEQQINDLARSPVGDVQAPIEARVVERPAARFTCPNDPMVAIRGAVRSLRHGHDGRGSADGKLTCRWPTHVVDEIRGIVAKDRFIRTLGSGSIPGEVVTLAREVVIHDPYHNDWLAAAVSLSDDTRPAVLRRLQGESVLRFGVDGTYDGATVAFSTTTAGTRDALEIGADVRRVDSSGQPETQRVVADQLRKFSLYKGIDPDLVGVTTWGQPWVPLWLEWEVRVEGVDPPTLRAWRLGTLDFENVSGAVDGDSAVLRGRSPLTTGAARTLHDAIADWLAAEDQLDEQQSGLVDEETEAALARLRDAVEHLDVVTAALDGIRLQLLGLRSSDRLRRSRQGGSTANRAPVASSRPVIAGMLALTRARLIDAFGRILDVPVDSIVAPTRETVDGRPGALAAPPRLLCPARWQFRLVDASTPVGVEGVEARVDQIEPALQVNPVAGFVMPDHLEESLEVCGVDGTPLGALAHEPVSGGVVWETAPLREGPADAGPLHGLTPAQQPLGRFAAGLVAADAKARGGAPLAPDTDRESALSALLRAIDTTSWSVDSYGALGSEHVAGLLGRPVAVVRVQLRLELKPPDDIDVSDPDRAAEWAGAARAAARYAFPVRIGEVTRRDDGVLGFFVDDDYSSFRLVDKVIAGAAVDGGRSRGQLGLHGSTGLPDTRPIAHEYITGGDDADTLMLHIGQTVTLTVFMYPAGKASLTSGVLPRKTLTLARDWVGSGLAAMAPSLRTGPVLVEADVDTAGQVRLPKVSVFGQDQHFLWRDTPATWRTDAILAATQTALLPDAPAEFREGWLRVAPTTSHDGSNNGGDQ